MQPYNYILISPRLVGLVLGLLLLSHFSISADFTSSAGGGNWNDTNSWNETGFPGAADNVTINSTINVNVASACTNLTINSGGVLAHTSNVTLDVSGDFTMNGTATVTPSSSSNSRILNITGSFDISTGADAALAGIQLNVTGTTTLDGDLTFTTNAGVKTFQGLVTLNAGSSWTSTAIMTTGNLIFQNSIINNGLSFAGGDVTFDSNAQSISGTTSVSFANDVNVTGITLTNDLVSPDEFSVTLDLQGTGGFTQGVDAILNIGDDVTIMTFTANASPNTVVYNTSSTSTLTCPTAATYHHLTIDKSAAVNATLPCSTAINGDLTISGGTLRSDDGTSYTHNVSGSTTISSTSATAVYDIQLATNNINVQDLTLDGGTITGAGTSSNFNVATTFNTSGAASAIDGTNFTVAGTSTIGGGLTFGSNTGVKTFQSLVTVNAGGSWTSTTIITNDNMVFQNGIVNNSTTFNAGAATFNTNNQSISGSESVNFSRDVTVTGITLTNNLVSPDALTITENLLGTGGLTQGTNALLNIGDDTSITTFTANANPNTVVYNTAVGSAMVCPTANTFHHLTIDKTASGVLTNLPCDLTINGDFTINGGTVRSDIGSGAFTHTVIGSTSILSGSSAGTYSIRDNASTLNIQDLTMDGGIITAGDATSNVNVASTFNTTGAPNTINDLNFTVIGASTIDGPLVLGTNTGVKTFQGLVTLSAGGSWTSDNISTANRLIFQNGIANDGTSFSAQDATFNTNGQNLSGGTTITFSGDVLSTGVEVTNNATVEMTDTGTGTLSGTGTWTQGAGTLEYAGQTITVGTFNASGIGNTINYNSAGAQDVLVPADGSYYNLTVQNSGTKTALASLTIDNDFSIGGTATFDASTNSADLIIAGDWDNSGTGFTQGTQSVTFNGSEAQTIGGSTGTDFYNLTLNNSLGSSPEFTLGIVTTVQNELTMTAGHLDLATLSLTLGTSAATPGTLIYTTGDLFNGSFTRYYDAVSIADGNVAGLFPMGDTDGNSRPFYVTPATAPATGGTVTLSVTTSNQASDITPVDDNGTDIIRQHQSSWDISTGSGLAGGDNYNLRAAGTGFGTIAAVSDLRLMTTSGVVGTDGGAGGSTSNPIIDRTGLLLSELANSFHIGSIDNADSPLPIELLSFDARFAKSGVVELIWSTLTEINNDYFTIERSADGVAFYDIAQIDGSGTSPEKNTYSHNDNNPLSVTSYYRLKQTDFDGKFEIFEPIKVEALFRNQASLYPNPLSNHTFNISFKSALDSPIKIKIYDHAGKQVDFRSNNLGTEIEIIPDSQLQQGVYFVTVQRGSDIIQQKLLVR